MQDYWCGSKAKLKKCKQYFVRMCANPVLYARIGAKEITCPKLILARSYVQ